MKAAIGMLAALGFAALATGSVHARGRGGNADKLPNLDVQRSCSDAQKYSAGNDKSDATYKGCIQDETAAKTALVQRWSSFNSVDRRNCVEQSHEPSPSYVEVLTCLEIGHDAMSNAPPPAQPPGPLFSGQVAPGINRPPTVPLGAPMQPAGRTVP